MKTIIKFIKNYSWVLYLGAMPFSGFDFTDWQWWAICVPTVILVELRDY